MAQGSIIWRCRICGNKSAGTCKHPRAGYSIVYWVGKRQKWQAIGRSKKDAEHRLVEVLGELHQGTYRQLRPAGFASFADRWLQEYVAGRVKPLTLRFYRSLIETHLKPAFGERLLADISTEQVEGFLAHALREKGLSPTRVNHLLITLKCMFRHACRWSLLRQNPAADIKRVPVQHQEMDFLTPHEIRLFLAKADEPYRTLFLTVILTGMRRGEVLALQWGDIDWQSSVIYVQRSIFWHDSRELRELGQGNGLRWRFASPKSKRSVRTIVMSPRLREALELYRLTCPVSSNDLVFCNVEGNPLDPVNLYNREFLPALNRAGLRRIRFHDLRHTYTALLIAQGAHAKFIQSQLGHASITTTLDRYGHLLPEVQMGAGERLDAMVFASETVPISVLER